MMELSHECGLMGAISHDGANVVEEVYLGLYALQHRGQEGAGIVSHNAGKTRMHRGLGLVSEVFSSRHREHLAGPMAIGHNRYATAGKATKLRNVQPLLVDCKGGKLAIAHNGTLVNALDLRRRMEEAGSIFQTTTDSEIILHLLARSAKETLPERLSEAVAQVAGAVTILLMDISCLVGYRDPLGFRPLMVGRSEKMTLLASESCAFDIVGARSVHEVAPGEMVILRGSEMERVQVTAPARLRQCIFELIYFSRPDSRIFGEPVSTIRRRLGAALARRHPVEADLVIAVPDSSNAASLGYADVSGIPFDLGLIRNHYVGRTFIKPGGQTRVDAVRVKFNAVREVLSGQRIVAVDDSIVRGTTSRQLVGLLRQGGAREVHLRISSPPIQYPCFYGIDTPTREELIAANQGIEEICRYIGADSLGYLTEQDLLAAVSAPDDYCLACFNGSYPTQIPSQRSSLAFDAPGWRG
jgi:amidophosphoribosyltransferase